MKAVTLKNIKEIVDHSIQKSEGRLALLFGKNFGYLDGKIDNLDISLNKRIDNLDLKIDDLRDEMVAKFNGTNNRIDDLAMNRVKYEDHQKLEGRVEKLEVKVFRRKLSS
jgi:hypothetical protein